MSISSLDFWDRREPKTPSDDALGTAIQVWAVMKENADGADSTITVGESATIFNVTPRRAARAIVNFPWMFLMEIEPGYGAVHDEADLNQYADKHIPGLVIEHDGE